VPYTLTLKNLYRLTTQFTHLCNVITTMTHLLLPYTALPR